LRLFRTVLGRGVHIERTEHLLEGARRCVYKIS
jgi:predicted ArsR family transcriptional regulator